VSDSKPYLSPSVRATSTLSDNDDFSFLHQFQFVARFIAAIWIVYFASILLPLNTMFGLLPRTLHGLVGIVAMPFLHASLWHILSNTFPLAVLLGLMAGSRPRVAEIVLEIMLLCGTLVWLFGRQGSIQVGASGLIFGLMAFLVMAGFRERNFLSLFIAVIVGIVYGGTFVTSMIPGGDPHVSWEGHLCGAVAGSVVAWARCGVAKR